ncbi:MAG TPA: hypothetical protein VER17_14350 [Tepidisphaeraceae bacterium]|nr:hypothetical protein [Tepidisphaeraceae bacterium]
MRRETRQLLSDLGELDWFFSVGTGTFPEVARVRSWDDALAASRAEEWQGSRIDQANAICLQLSSDEMKRWNPTVQVIKPEVEELVEERTRRSHRVLHDVDEVRRVASWDLLHACMECEFADRLRTRFYRDTVTWYFRGHYPCGWAEHPPPQRHVIF